MQPQMSGCATDVTICVSQCGTACADIGMSWRNAGNEIIIEALCPKDLQPKDLKCSFNSHTLLLEVAGKPIATGKLSAAIKPDECTWEFGPLLPHPLRPSVTLETASA